MMEMDLKPRAADNFSRNLFWDANNDEIDMEKNIGYIVNRVLDYGRWEDWLFIRKYYGMDKIRETALRLRSMYPESLAFIATMTQVPETQFRCYELLQSKDSHWYF